MEISMNYQYLYETNKKLKEIISEDTGTFLKLKSKLPNIYKAWVKWSKMSYENPETVDEVNTLIMSDGTKIYWVQSPSHSWFFNEKGSNIGEEDGGIDHPLYKKYNDEMWEIIKKKPTNQFFTMR
jgi:hypothetical protein